MKATNTTPARAHYFRDFYGETASIKPARGKWTLRACDAYGELFYRKTYDTYRGAKIALGKLSDAWSEVS